MELRDGIPRRAMIMWAPRADPRALCSAPARGARPGRLGVARPPGSLDRRASRARLGVARASEESSGEGDLDAPEPSSLESQFMTILREQTTRRRLEMETRWKQGGLRPRVVHESSSEWIRRVDFQFPLAAMGTASGAVLVSECTDHSGSPEERRARSQRLVASMPDAHSRDWKAADERGLGERSLLGLYDAGAVTAVALDARRDRGRRRDGEENGLRERLGEPLVASGGRDGYLRLWRVPHDAMDDADLPAKKKKYRSNAGARLARRGAAKHPNVVTSVTLDPATDTCWTTCLDGVLRRWRLPSDDETSDGSGNVEKDEIGPGPETENDETALTLLESLETSAPALCSSLCPLERVVYVGTADGDAYAFDAGETLTMAAAGDVALDGGAPPETSGVLCRWAAHEAGATRAVAAAAGGCVTGSSTGPILAWKFRRGGAPTTPPALVSKLLGHVAAVVGLSTGNPAHLVSGAHDGTVRVWDMPRLSDAPGAPGAEAGTDLAGVVDDAPRGPPRGQDPSGERGPERGPEPSESESESGSAGGSASSASAFEDAEEKAAAAPPPSPERREALYAGTGHTVWLGDVCADDERIVCDGANNVTICYDFTEDPDGDGEI